MFPKLSKNSKYKIDLEKYASAIDKIQDIKIKRKFYNLLQDFRKNCELIDSAHNYYNNGKIDPRNIRNNVSHMLDQRKQLEKMLKDLDNA